MARLSRLVIPGMPHHLTQRGNRRQPTFFYPWQGRFASFVMDEVEELRRHGRTGRPLGDEIFLDRLEGLVDRVLKPQKGGRPKKEKNQ